MNVESAIANIPVIVHQTIRNDYLNVDQFNTDIEELKLELPLIKVQYDKSLNNYNDLSLAIDQQNTTIAKIISSNQDLNDKLNDEIQYLSSQFHRTIRDLENKLQVYIATVSNQQKTVSFTQSHN